MAKLTYTSILGLTFLSAGASLLAVLAAPEMKSFIVSYTLIGFGVISSILSITGLTVDEARLPVLGLGFISIGLGGGYLLILLRSDLLWHAVAIVLALIGIALLILGIKRSFEF